MYSSGKHGTDSDLELFCMQIHLCCVSLRAVTTGGFTPAPHNSTKLASSTKPKSKERSEPATHLEIVNNAFAIREVRVAPRVPILLGV